MSYESVTPFKAKLVEAYEKIKSEEAIFSCPTPSLSEPAAADIIPKQDWRRQRKINLYCQHCGAHIYGTRKTFAKGFPICACGNKYVLYVSKVEGAVTL